jgi:signal transduction histidine kinase
LLFVSGALQAVPLLQFSALSDGGRAVLTMTLVIVATVSVVTTSGFKGVFIAFAAPMLLPLMLAWWFYGSARGDYVLAGVGPLLVPYSLFLVAVGRHANSVFIESCTYRFGEQQRNLELQRALAEADEANRAKTQFLAAASHDLRQPIHSMNVLVAALSLRPLDGPTKEIVGLLGSVNQTLSKQLDTLLDVSKLDAGVVRAELAPHALDAIVRAHHAAIAPLATQRGLRLTLAVDDEIWVRTDAALLARALSNLSDNAIKYTPAGGTVHLAARIDGTHALLQVADTGIGIVADEQERVFREFYQVGNVERDRSKGLGLGLSIVKRLCKLLAIELRLESAPGAGTTVTLRLPQTPARPPPAPAADDAAQRRTQGLRVLVIDDESMVRDSMRLLLQELQCKVHLAEGVAEGARIAAVEPLDLVLSDLRLRGGDTGLAAVQAVREHQPALPAVLITGDTAPERIRDVQNAGVPLLFKPVTLEDLVAVMPLPP